MATYTTLVRTLVENHFDLGLKDYPIFDENYRATLNDKIIKHYYFREIGLETPGLFKFYLNQKLAEIMPYYNKLYKSELIEFNPLYNVLQHDNLHKANRIYLLQTIKPIMNNLYYLNLYHLYLLTINLKIIQINIL